MSIYDKHINRSIIIIPFVFFFSFLSEVFLARTSHKQVIWLPLILEIHHINAYYNIKKGTEMEVLWRVKKQFADLVAENDVSHTKVDQEKRQYQRSKDEVCYTKKTKETNPGNFTMVRYWRGIKIIITVSSKSSAHKIGKKCSQLKELWCYSGPSRSYNIRYEEGCLHQIYKLLKHELDVLKFME